jgi:hypothetical protein
MNPFDSYFVTKTGVPRFQRSLGVLARAGRQVLRFQPLVVQVLKWEVLSRVPWFVRRRFLLEFRG